MGEEGYFFFFAGNGNHVERETSVFLLSRDPFPHRVTFFVFDSGKPCARDGANFFFCGANGGFFSFEGPTEFFDRLPIGRTDEARRTRNLQE